MTPVPAGMVRLTCLPCPWCGVQSVIEVPHDGYVLWTQGAYIRDAFPHLTPDEVELLITGSCPACWENLKPAE